jgi:N-ethylmaleimide reductase
VRFSPIVDYGDTHDPHIEDTILQAAAWLDSRSIAYVHLIESENTDLLGDTLNGQQGESVAGYFREQLRERFSGTIILAYRYDRERAEKALASGVADVIAFGRPFIANPDLVERLHRGVELAESDTTTWYGGGAKGYTDYPAAVANAVSTS